MLMSNPQILCPGSDSKAEAGASGILSILFLDAPSHLISGLRGQPDFKGHSVLSISPFWPILVKTLSPQDRAPCSCVTTKYNVSTCQPPVWFLYNEPVVG